MACTSSSVIRPNCKASDHQTTARCPSASEYCYGTSELNKTQGFSPFGVVSKANSDPTTTGRTIHDLSFPDQFSVNDLCDRDSFQAPSYAPCGEVAREFIKQRRQSPDPNKTKLLAGDVSSAFRHIGIHSRCAFLFGGLIRERGLNYVVIDLFCPFGWSASPSCYDTFAGAISHIHRHTPSPLGPSGNFAYHWVDDHLCVAQDVVDNSSSVEASLRQAMITVLDSTAINESKFSDWHESLKVLGLIFDTHRLQVLMPKEKIAKARSIVSSAYNNSDSLSRQGYRSLLGSLRHVASCIRPARAFLQRLRSRERFLHRIQSVPIGRDMRDDLIWWWQILHMPALNGIPLQYFQALPAPDVVVEVDASDYGCCALDLSNRSYFTYVYDESERRLINDFHNGAANSFDINFREITHVRTRRQRLGRPVVSPTTATNARPLQDRQHVGGVMAIQDVFSESKSAEVSIGWLLNL